MRLAQFRVRKFRNVVDSGDIAVEPDVSCLVGMNEAGKTAVLAALNRLNPTDGSSFTVRDDYPRWLLTHDRRSGRIDDTRPIEATFVLDASDVDAVAETFGEGVLSQGDEIGFYRTYSGEATPALPINPIVAVSNLIDRADVAAGLAQTLRAAQDFPELKQTIAEMQASQQDGVGDAERQAELTRLASQLARATNEGARPTAFDAVWGVLQARLPQFFYFGEYQYLPGRIDLSTLDMDHADRAGSTANQTMRSLLALANTTPEDLTGADYEGRKAELEAVSNDLTEQVFTYWKQNPNLRVTFDVDRKAKDNANHGQPPIITPILHIRVEDTRHRFTNSFDQRSSGFRWFFSFLAAFTEFETRQTLAKTVVLLDEPGLTLHGRAQADFLHFINARLAPAAQVLYTTHSPFMVQTDKLQRVRIVEDGGPQSGATVSKEVLRVGDDSLFPLQAALGYDVVQHLFIGEANLLVEGPSDLIYLDTLSRHLKSKGMPHLDVDWRIMPAGGANNIPAFVALIGTTMEVSVLIDGGTEGAQRLQRAIEGGRLKQRRLIEVSAVTESAHGDIEDVFTSEDYLALFNAAFDQQITTESLPEGDRILRRIAAQFPEQTFDHYRPAETLLREQATLLSSMSERTLAQFAALFTAINASRT